jgi:hypothetical protein
LVLVLTLRQAGHQEQCGDESHDKTAALAKYDKGRRFEVRLTASEHKPQRQLRLPVGPGLGAVNQTDVAVAVCALRPS